MSADADQHQPFGALHALRMRLGILQVGLVIRASTVDPGRCAVIDEIWAAAPHNGDTLPRIDRARIELDCGKGEHVGAGIERVNEGPDACSGPEKEITPLRLRPGGCRRWTSGNVSSGHGGTSLDGKRAAAELCRLRKAMRAAAGRTCTSEHRRGGSPRRTTTTVAAEVAAFSASGQLLTRWRRAPEASPGTPHLTTRWRRPNR